jgi:hypothetical protein
MEATEGDWKEFEQWLNCLRTKYAKNGLVFRGQSSSEWSLETTLERQWPKTMSFHDYYLLTVRVGPAVETFARVIAPEYDAEVLNQFGNIMAFDGIPKFPHDSQYKFMVYLRHHGFPSPLLDWSKSPYIAAFFAFRDGNPKFLKRSIYAYCERPDGIKGGTLGEPTISILGPYVRSHPRHFRQQSTYTICDSHNKVDGWVFDSHEKVFKDARSGQDLLWRFDLPSSEREKVLQLLNDYNLNAYSLFDSEESLLETMWYREQILKSRA